MVSCLVARLGSASVARACATQVGSALGSTSRVRLPPEHGPALLGSSRRWTRCSLLHTSSVQFAQSPTPPDDPNSNRLGPTQPSNTSHTYNNKNSNNNNTNSNNGDNAPDQPPSQEAVASPSSETSQQGQSTVPNANEGSQDAPIKVDAATSGVPTGKKLVRKRKKKEVEPNPYVTDLTFKYPPGSKAAEAYESLMETVKTQRTKSSGLNDGQAHAPAIRKWYKSPVAILLALVPIVTFGLGVWQVKRLNWKLNLIEELEDKLLDFPLQLPRNINTNALDDFSFRLVDVRGRFDTTGAMLFLGPRVRDGINGYNIVVPFIRVDEEGNEMPPVLVNRGFVSEDHFCTNRPPEDLKQTIEARTPYEPLKFYAQPDRVTPQSAELGPKRQSWSEWLRGQSASAEKRTPKTHPYITLTTILPRIYPNSAFTPTNQPGSNQWFSVDPRAMATRLREVSSDPAVTSGVGILPVYLEEVFDGPNIDALHRMTEGYPLGKPKIIEIRNQHATYAFTWFSLSAFTAVGWLYIKASRYGRK